HPQRGRESQTAGRPEQAGEEVAVGGPPGSPTTVRGGPDARCGRCHRVGSPDGGGPGGGAVGCRFGGQGCQGRQVLGDPPPRPRPTPGPRPPPTRTGSYPGPRAPAPAAGSRPDTCHPTANQRATGSVGPERLRPLDALIASSGRRSERRRVSVSCFGNLRY